MQQEGDNYIITAHRQYSVPYAISPSTEQSGYVQEGIDSCCELRLAEELL